MSAQPRRQFEDDFIPEEEAEELEDTAPSEDPAYKAARKRVKEIKEFYTHVAIFIIVNGFLFLLNMLTSPDSLWFYWPLLGWGIGLGAHAYTVYGENGVFGKDWEDRKIRELMGEKRKRHD